MIRDEIMPELTEELKIDVDDCIKTELENMKLIMGIKSKKKKGKKKGNGEEDVKVEKVVEQFQFLFRNSLTAPCSQLQDLPAQ
jgi:hypothetical protein